MINVFCNLLSFAKDCWDKAVCNCCSVSNSRLLIPELFISSRDSGGIEPLSSLTCSNTVQKGILSVAQRDFKTSIEKYVRFYEIDCASNYISDKNSLSAISSVDENSQIKRDFEEIIGEPLQTSKLHFTKRGEDNQGDSWLSIEIEPRLESTGNVYFCRLIVRGQKIEPLFKFLRRSSEIFEKAINRLEK